MDYRKISIVVSILCALIASIAPTPETGIVADLSSGPAQETVFAANNAGKPGLPGQFAIAHILRWSTALHISDMLETRNIDATFQSLIGPLPSLSLVVPREHVTEARQCLRSLPVEEVVRVLEPPYPHTNRQQMLYGSLNWLLDNTFFSDSGQPVRDTLDEDLEPLPSPSLADDARRSGYSFGDSRY